jgi:opacity protein-like surface antigen
MSPMRRVCFLSVVAILAASIASAQSSPSTNSSAPGLFAAGESSSAALLLADGDGGSLPSLIPLHAASAAAGGGAAGQADHGWKHKVSNDFAFEAGGGFNAPIGNDTPVITWGGNFTVGAGLHFSKRISLLAEYQFIGDKLPGALIADAGAQGGNAHIWSLTLDPVIDLLPKHNNSVYVTGGGGFYRKLTSFTDPEEVEECYYFCGIGVENVTVGHFSSNQGGVNLGLGFTHRIGGVYGDSKTKLFAEARYLFLETPGVNQTNGLGTTELLPVTLGVRW